MCGIFGYYNTDKINLPESKINAMGDIIGHRGPDGKGTYVSDGILLGNQRLSIIDVDNGNQPFYSECGKVIVVQNGEIFNHLELAVELEGSEYQCKTGSDTEVILRLYLKYGIEFIEKLNGMFAIAIFDHRTSELHLVRDRVGEKPLYYYKDGAKFIFASEIKSILAAGIKRELNCNALDSFLSFNYVTPPMTMFEGVSHVMPGHYITVSLDNITDNVWWDLSKIKAVDRSEVDCIEEIRKTLDSAVELRLRSDVPFGAFLSGGVDSSSVVGVMAKYLQKPVKTFSIGFNDPKFDETPFAIEASNRFSTEHKFEKVESNLLGLWEKVTYHCDQPHGDVSFMPMYRVAKLASNQVKMVLTGDGADELFCGYDKYKDFFSSENSDNLSNYEFQEVYRKNISLFNDEEKKSLYKTSFCKYVDLNGAASIVNELCEKSKNMDRINQALYIDVMLLLPGNNLVKPDRMGMAASIENRSPFLDFRMIELAFSMPGSLKLKNGETKYIFKKSVEDLIGPDLAYRKKQMFTVPIGEWLKYELRELVEDLLLSERAVSRGIFNSNYLKQLYSDHCTGEKNNTREIRAIMALEIWFRIFIDKSSNYL